jgi:hypothetical protein
VIRRRHAHSSRQNGTLVRLPHESATPAALTRLRLAGWQLRLPALRDAVYQYLAMLNAGFLIQFL